MQEDFVVEKKNELLNILWRVETFVTGTWKVGKGKQGECLPQRARRNNRKLFSKDNSVSPFSVQISVYYTFISLG